MVLGIQDICNVTSRDIEYYPFYFQGYGILSILLPRIWDTIHFTSRDMGYSVKLKRYCYFSSKINKYKVHVEDKKLQ